MKGVNKGDYSLQYHGVEKSYIVEPHGGKINYNLVKKDITKFYDQVFAQQITKTKFAEDKNSPSPKKQLSQKVTKRPHHKIMDKIRVKMISTIKEKMMGINESLLDKLNNDDI